MNIELESTWDFGSFEGVPKVHYLGRPSGYAVYDELCGFHSLDDTENVPHDIKENGSEDSSDSGTYEESDQKQPILSTEVPIEHRGKLKNDAS